MESRWGGWILDWGGWRIGGVYVGAAGIKVGDSLNQGRG